MPCVMIIRTGFDEDGLCGFTGFAYRAGLRIAQILGDGALQQDYQLVDQAGGTPGTGGDRDAGQELRERMALVNERVPPLRCT